MGGGNDFLMGPRVVRFTARYDSECECCDGAIWEGEVAGYVGDEVFCEDCLDSEEAS